MSASYGPGRYDPNYEEKGQDYPVGFVRWTEQRNFEAVLDMMSEGRLDVKPLISHRFPIDNASDAYDLISGDQPSLGILLTYPGAEIQTKARTVTLMENESEQRDHQNKNKRNEISVSFIGAGNYSTRTPMPAFVKASARLRCVASSGGVSGVYAGRKFGFEETTTDAASILNDADTDAVVITTRHNTHAKWVVEALQVQISMSL